MNTTSRLLPMFSSSSFQLRYHHHHHHQDNSTLTSPSAFSENNTSNNGHLSPSIVTHDFNTNKDEYKFHPMSTALNPHSSSVHLNDRYFQYIHPSDSHHQQQQMTSSNNVKERETSMHSPSLLSNHFNEDEHCQVCGDFASGWHCGAITCEACKKFFLRSISTGDGKKKYKCQRDLTCSITKRLRTQCQYCRFQKCLFVGMKPHESIGPKTEDLYKKLPCLVCGACASGIHFGAVTCEACKGFFRRSIREHAPERYHCAENNNCEIVSAPKITCRACRFRKCVEAGMSMDASRIGRQSNLFKERFRQLQNGSSTMATVTDSARIASMAKRRKTKIKSGRVFASSSDIEMELSSLTKEFTDKVYHAYLMHLKDLPRCIPHETVWWTMASQMITYAQALMSFCQKTVPGFVNMFEKYHVISSSINSVIMLSLFYGRTSMKCSSHNNDQSLWNYWQADSTLSMELNAYVPQMNEAENAFRSYQSKLRDLQLDEKEFSLLLMMIITRTNLSVMNEENKSWTKCQYECVQAFSEYTQARRLSVGSELSSEFYDIAFLVSQLRSLNSGIGDCLMNVPWPYIRNLPSYFYRIYVPSFDSSSTMSNSNLYN